VLVSLAALGVLAVVALIVGLVLNNRSASIEDELADVPSVLGLLASNAEAEIRAAGLEPEEGEPINDRTCTIDEVVEQTPVPGGEQVPLGTTVTYQICGGPAQVEVPNVVGSTEEAATRQLTDRGLDVSPEGTDSSAPEGTVVGTDPGAGETVDEGSTVTIYVSRANIAGVPNVVGETARDAEINLRSAGFDVRVQNAQDAPQQANQVGTVAAQDPADGNAERGSTVTIFVYTEPDPLVVSEPQVDGFSVEVNWDNGVFGPVEINWGDEQIVVGDAQGPGQHVYAEPGSYRITISSQEGRRSESVTVVIEEPDDDDDESGGVAVP
jgi:eukaryotic-like serine/threonine-protein kinase